MRKSNETKANELAAQRGITITTDHNDLASELDRDYIAHHTEPSRDADATATGHECAGHPARHAQLAPSEERRRT